MINWRKFSSEIIGGLVLGFISFILYIVLGNFFHGNIYEKMFWGFNIVVAIIFFFCTKYKIIPIAFYLSLYSIYYFALQTLADNFIL